MHACPLPESTLNPTPTPEMYKTTDCISTFDYLQTEMHKYGVKKKRKKERKKTKKKKKKKKNRKKKKSKG